MTAKDAKKGNVYYNVTATIFSVNDATDTADALAMPETDSLNALADSSLNLTDALSFGSYDTDALANTSASALADLDDKSGWLDIASLA
jgi:hypothetical protein